MNNIYPVLHVVQEEGSVYALTVNEEKLLCAPLSGDFSLSFEEFEPVYPTDFIDSEEIKRISLAIKTTALSYGKAN